LSENVADAMSATLGDQFRQAMRRLIATVTIVTAGDAQSRAGMIATAVMSMSAEPPSLAIGVNRETGVWQAIAANRRFSVNLLATKHTQLVLPFSGQLQGEERFTVGDWQTHASHVPYLVDAVVSIFCRMEASVDYGTHSLFVGEVEDIRMQAGSGDPLLWSNGSFANAVPLDELLN
jgi:flavin reductase